MALPLDGLYEINFPEHKAVSGRQLMRWANEDIENDRSALFAGNGIINVEDALAVLQDSGSVGVIGRLPSMDSQVVGAFIDSVAGPQRTPAAVAARLLEEVVELCLAAGCDAGTIFAHVADSLHNQCLKAGERMGRTVFPTRIDAADAAEIGPEAADVSVLLKDLCHVARIDLTTYEQAKWAAFTKKEFWVSPAGTIYAVKPHIKDQL